MWPRSESLRDAAVSTANWLWLIAAGAAIVGAAYLLGQLSALRDSTRFASDLAEIRTFAMRVALVSETVRGGDSREYLEHELELAHQQSESLTAGILDILGAEVGEQQMRAVVASWDAVAEASRGHADGSVDAASLLAAAERATADVDTVIELVARRNEEAADRLRVLLGTGIVAGMVGAAASAGALTWAVRQLRDSHQRELRNAARFEALVQNASDAILVVSPGNGRISYASPSVALVFGLDVHREDALAHHAHSDDLPHLLTALAAEQARGTVGFRLRAGEDWRDVEAVVSDLRADPLVSGVVLNMRDVTERRRLESELQHRALHDTLTGLPNRALLCDRITHSLARAHASPPDLAVLFIDLDDFKAVNDSLGHAAGDYVLREVAARLVNVVGPTATVARLAGDEFAVVLERVSLAEALGTARRLAEAVGAPLAVEGRTIRVGASIGVTAPDRSGVSPEILLRDADVAMYAAKRRSPGSVSLFDRDLHAAVLDRSTLEIELRGAAERGELRLMYQPIVELATGVIRGHEALVRWQHPTRGLLSPDQFIPLAEAAGSIVELDSWVLAEASADAGRRYATTGRDIYIAVNVSPAHFERGGLVERVAEALRASGLPARLLTIELTESMLVQDPQSACSTIDSLRALGVRLAIDDFGTGYSSLAQLREFPPDLLKIDRSFVGAGEAAERNAPFIRMILDLARSLGVDVVAEGIESADQAEYLRALGCRLGQGYLFGRPSATPVLDLLQRAA